MRIPEFLTNGQNIRDPAFDKRLIVGGIAAAGFVLSILMRSRCNFALQTCPQCISLGMPTECIIADAISMVAIGVLGMLATTLAFQHVEQPQLPV